jgi:hypothetical protein
VAEAVLDNEGERDGDEDGGKEDDDDSDNDLEIVVEKSGTPDSTGASSGGTEVPTKKAKTMLTQEEETFAKKFQPPASKIEKTRKIDLRHVSGWGASLKKQGARRHDVEPETTKQRLLDFPNQFLQVQGGPRLSSQRAQLSSSMRLTMTIRRGLTPTTLNYRVVAV